MVIERDRHADEHDGDAQHDAHAQDGDNRRVHPVLHAVTPLKSICAARTVSTTRKQSRTRRLLVRPSVCEPMNAPPITPMATGPAMNGSICPREKYTPALAAAVTPIMKLLVAVDTLIGSSIARSMAGTFNAPEPMPRRPLITPATYMSARPMRARLG